MQILKINTLKSNTCITVLTSNSIMTWNIKLLYGKKNVIKKLHVLKNEALISISKMDGKCAKTVMPRQ